MKMDDFLTKLFQEEQEKVASAELDQFMTQLSTDDLEDFLGIRKVAVEGKPEPSLPESLPVGKLEALQQQKRDYVDQEHEGKPKSVADQPEGAQTRVKYEGPGKEATGKPAEDAATEKVGWADRIGRLFAKKACAMTKADEFTTPEAKVKAKAFSATLKASKGQPVATRKAALQGTEKAIEKKAFLPGAIAGYLAQGDPESTPRSGFWRGALGGIPGAMVGGLGGAGIGHAIGGLEGAMLGNAIGSLGGNIAGGYLAGRTARATPEEMELYKAKLRAKADKTKESEGMPESEGAGMESTAAAKAKIAARAMKVTEGAPEYVKAAAVFLAGQEIAKLNR